GKYELAVPPPPRDVGGDDEGERGEEATQRHLGQRGRDEHTGLDARDRRDADHDRGTPFDVAVALLAPDPGACGRQDRGERRRLGVQLPESEGEQCRHEQNSAADSEEAREDTRGDAEHEREQDRGHETSSTTPTTTSNAANANESQRW